MEIRIRSCFLDPCHQGAHGGRTAASATQKTRILHPPVSALPSGKGSGDGLQSQSLWSQQPGNKVTWQSYCHSISHRMRTRHWAQHSGCTVSPRILTRITLRDQGCDRCHPSLEMGGSERSGGLSMVTKPIQGKRG